VEAMNKPVFALIFLGFLFGTQRQSALSQDVQRSEKVQKILSQLDKKSPIVLLGCFYSSNFTEEHQYIYRVDLWRQGNAIVGLYAFWGGLSGDGPNRMGAPIMIGGEQDPKTKQIWLEGEKFQFRFNGRLADSVLEGNLEDSLTVQPQKIKMTRNTLIEDTILRFNQEPYSNWLLWLEAQKQIRI
jgi:hypothetical protein